MTGPDSGNAQHERLAVALLRKTESVLGLGHLPAAAVHEPVFEPGHATLGQHPLASLDIITVMVAVQEEIGVALFDTADLAEAGSLAGVAALAASKADRLAVERFCAAWENAGEFLP